MKRLKYDKKTIRDVALLFENHLRPHTFKMGWTDSAVRRYIIDSGELINENIQAETNQVMRNIESVLKASNRNFDNVVKSTIFLKDLNDFSIVNEVYSKYFKNKISPARETVEVARLPKDANVEISVIAY